MSDQDHSAKPQTGSSWVRRLWAFVAIAFGAVMVLAALAVGLFRVLVPLVPDYHARIEDAASKAIGFPVHVEKIDARWRLGGPEIVLTNTRVMSADQSRQLFGAATGRISLDVTDYVRHRQLRPDLVALRDVELNVRRSGDGALEISGKSIQRAARAEQQRSGPPWLIPDGRFELRDARIIYSDEISGRPALDFPDVDLNVEIDGTRLRLDGSAELPGDIGRSIEISAEADGTLAQRETLQWQVYVTGDRLDLAGVQWLIPERLRFATRGSGDLTLWANLRSSRVQQASLTLDVETLQLQIPGGQPMDYDRLSGRFEWDRDGNGWRGRATELVIERGTAWPATDIVVQSEKTSGDGRRFYLATQFLRLEDLAVLLDAVPEWEIAKRLQSAAPRGIVSDVELHAERNAERVWDYSFDAKFTNLIMTAVESWPGVGGLDGTVRFDETRGSVEFTGSDVALDAPALLRQGFVARNLDGVVIWRQNADGWRILSDRWSLATEHFNAAGHFELALPADTSPLLDLELELNALDLASAGLYLPAKVMKPKLVEWLDTALTAGTLTNSTVTFHGPLEAFPFDNDEGVFDARLAISGMDMTHTRGWPAATGIDAVMVFENESLSSEITKASIRNVPLKGVTIDIADLRNTRLDIKGSATAPLADFFAYLDATPLSDKYSGAWRDLEPLGSAFAEIRLDLPLKNLRQNFDYDIQFFLEGATIGRRGWQHQLEALTGSVGFRRSGVTSENLNGLILGRPVSIELSSEQRLSGSGEQQPATVARVAGRADAIVLGERLYAPFADMLRGSCDWTASLHFPIAGDPLSPPLEVELQSPLSGMAVTLPEPFTKAPEADRFLKMRFAFPQTGRSIVDLEYGGDVLGAFEIERIASEWGLRRGDLRVGGAVPQLAAEPGLRIAGFAPRFNLDDWLARAKDGRGSLRQYLREADVTVDSLRALGQELGSSNITLDRNVGEWLVEVSSDAVSGAVFVPFTLRGDVPVIANLERLIWKSGDGESDLDPRSLPGLRLDAQDFVYDNMRLGALRLEVDPVPNGVAMTRFASSGNGVNVDAGGSWLAVENGQRTDIDVVITSDNVAAMLNSLDFAPSVDSGSARFEGVLSWPDGPSPDYKRKLSGSVRVAVGSGQLNDVQPGAGRVFGLLSIAALPRRLSLDFSDVFDKGFAFDSIEGDFDVRDGHAYTENLTLLGPAAQVGIVGRAGIADRDYDQTAVIYANFGSSLPIAGAIAGGPALGAALLVFSEIFKDPLKKATRANYSITGSWDEPDVVRIAPNTRSEPAAAQGES